MHKLATLLILVATLLSGCGMFAVHGAAAGGSGGTTGRVGISTGISW